jgi:ubiquinone/menaquinone biosynthesis C-methylase UbiE
VIAASLGLVNCRFQEGDATDLHELEDDAFDLAIAVFGAMLSAPPRSPAPSL